MPHLFSFDLGIMLLELLFRILHPALKVGDAVRFGGLPLHGLQRLSLQLRRLLRFGGMLPEPPGQFLEHVVVGAIALKVDVLRHPVVQSAAEPAGLVIRCQVAPLPEVHEQAVGFVGFTLFELVLFGLGGLFIGLSGHGRGLLGPVPAAGGRHRSR